MYSTTTSQRQSFPELVGQNAQQAAAYIAAHGLRPEILREGDPTTRDLRMDRVRIITDPTRTVVIRPPNVG